MRHHAGPTLAERSRRALDQAEPERQPSEDDPERTRRTPPVGRRHCWVTNLPEMPGRRFAGLVVCWRPAPNGWCGRTIYVVDEQGDAVVVEAWVPAEHLHPL